MRSSGVSAARAASGWPGRGYQGEGDRVEVDEGERFGGGREPESADIVAGIQQQGGLESSLDHIGEETVAGAFGVDLEVDVRSTFGKSGDHRAAGRSRRGFPARRAGAGAVRRLTSRVACSAWSSSARAHPCNRSPAGVSRIPLGPRTNRATPSALFQSPDLLGDGRGGEAERDGGIGHGSVADDGFEGAAVGVTPRAQQPARSVRKFRTRRSATAVEPLVCRNAQWWRPSTVVFGELRQS